MNSDRYEEVSENKGAAEKFNGPVLEKVVENEVDILKTLIQKEQAARIKAEKEIVQFKQDIVELMLEAEQVADMIQRKCKRCIIL